ncbi:phosphatase PAP2 family protein [Kocuria massiliensis]|uniref:phosphatase PAP2 family protein n=1 Tax=Kocuria massiliensis TaxID=1926282 RepID=UPI000A1C867C|nr:phosphatase PAP2 family protein [Kocuria massiliensis]
MTTEPTPAMGQGPDRDWPSARRKSSFQPPTTKVVIKHLIVLAVMIAGLWATIWAFLDSYSGQWIDQTALSEVSNNLRRYSQSSVTLLNALPLISGVLALIGIVIVLVRRHRFVPALIGLLTAAGANGTTQLLKSSILDKPNLGVQEATMNSLPSGHTTFAAAAGAALFLAAPKKWRPFLSLLMFLFSVVTGVATVINEWHRPADIVAALFVVGAWTTIGLLTLRFIPAEDQDTSSTRHTGMLIIPLMVISGLFLGFCAVATYTVSATQHFAGAALLGSLCLILAVGMINTAMLVWLLRRKQPLAERPYTKVWTY